MTYTVYYTIPGDSTEYVASANGRTEEEAMNEFRVFNGEDAIVSSIELYK